MGGWRHTADDDGLLSASPRPGHTRADWLEDVPLHAGPPHVRLGTGRVAERDWLLPDEHREAELALKRRLLRERRREVLAVAGSDESAGRAARATRALLTDWLGRHRPDLLPSRPGPDADVPTGGGGELAAAELDAAARLVQEDLCLMRVGAGPPVLTAAVVCFPSHWRLGDKIGRPMAAIHAPVPDYADSLGHRPDRVLEHLGPDRIVGRRNWSIHDGADLFAPDRPPPRSLTVAEVPGRLWLRSERQTLRQLPDGDHVLFTIRVQQAPLGALADRPAVADRLSAAIRSEAPDRLDRLAGGQVEPVLAWLDGVTR